MLRYKNGSLNEIAVRTSSNKPRVRHSPWVHRLRSPLNTVPDRIRGGGSFVQQSSSMTMFSDLVVDLPGNWVATASKAPVRVYIVLESRSVPEGPLPLRSRDHLIWSKERRICYWPLATRSELVRRLDSGFRAVNNFRRLVTCRTKPADFHA